jgi:hypothetical protein
MSHSQNIGKNHYMKIANFIYLERTVRNENLIHEEIRSTLNSDNACYH